MLNEPYLAPRLSDVVEVERVVDERLRRRLFGLRHGTGKYKSDEGTTLTVEALSLVPFRSAPFHKNESFRDLSFHLHEHFQFSIAAILVNGWAMWCIYTKEALHNGFGAICMSHSIGEIVGAAVNLFWCTLLVTFLYVAQQIRLKSHIKNLKKNVKNKLLNNISQNNSEQKIKSQKILK